ncbi:hypothetical protein CVT24_007142 [Panaeolus cyanescens]|uniref:Uncharacterized protein n=1 Tax=Panaeolus cyanescens TaxID=181874 RepID=A0A409YPH0_9AGAR|nr:hypothetical protein CVT24_007142 [Panaeolus cyanescens]
MALDEAMASSAPALSPTGTTSFGGLFTDSVDEDQIMALPTSQRTSTSRYHDSNATIHEQRLSRQARQAIRVAGSADEGSDYEASDEDLESTIGSDSDEMELSTSSNITVSRPAQVKVKGKQTSKPRVQRRNLVAATYDRQPPGQLANSRKSDPAKKAFVFLDSYECNCLENLGTCQVLARLQFKYNEECNIVTCFEHSRAVLLEHWNKHLKNADHNHVFRSCQKRKSKEIAAMKEHVEQRFQPLTNVEDAKRLLPATLKKHLKLKDTEDRQTFLDASNRSVSMRYKCPKCGTFCAVSTTGSGCKTHGLSQHILKEHKVSIKTYPLDQLQPFCTQKLLLHGRFTFTFLLDEEITDALTFLVPERTHNSSESTAPCNPLVPACADTVQRVLEVKWLSDLGWEDYRSTVLLRYNFSLLKSLIGFYHLGRIDGSNLSNPRCRLEQALQTIYELIPVYLQDANNFLGECHECIRKEIDSGSNKGGYRQLSAGKYKEYGRALFGVVAFVMRSILLGKDQNQDSAPSTIYSSNNQQKAAYILCRTLLQQDGDLNTDKKDQSKLLSSLHNFLDTLLRSDMEKPSSISCPTDQYLVLASLSTDDQFRGAKDIATTCAMLRHCFYGIFVHSCRLANEKSDVFHFHSLPPTSETDTELEDYMEEDIDALSAYQDAEQLERGASMTLQELDRSFEIEEQRLSNSKTVQGVQGDGDKMVESSSANLLQTVRENLKWVTTKPEPGTSTPFSRIHDVWACVNGHAYEEPGSTIFASQHDGYRWAFGKSTSHMKTIDMRLWSKACENAIQLFQQSVELIIFQNHVTNQFSELLEQYPLSLLKDSYSPASPHRQEGNSLWTTEFQKSWTQKAFGIGATTDSIDSTKVLESLNKERAVLSHLTTILSLGCGVSLRSWQFASVYYDSFEDSLRNVWFLDGSFVVTHPKAKQRNVARAPSLHALPKCISHHLMVYLYLFRPLLCNALLRMDVDTGGYAYAVWCSMHHSTTPKTTSKPTPTSIVPQYWSGTSIGTVLKSSTKATIGIPVTPLLARQVSQAVFRDKFPQLMETAGIRPTIVMQTLSTVWPSWPTIASSIGIQMMMVSRVWQDMLQIEQLESTWKDSIIGHHMLGTYSSDTTASWPIALTNIFAGLSLVSRNIQVPQDNISDSVKMFLTNDDIRKSVLIPAITGLMFGRLAVRVDIDLPLYGLREDIVARAIQLVSSSVLFPEFFFDLQ